MRGWQVGCAKRARRFSESAAGVLYIADSGHIGGANRICMDLMSGLDPVRYSPYLVAPAEGELTDWANGAGIPWRIVPNGDHAGRVGLVKRLHPLVSAARSANAQIIHAVDIGSYRAAGLVGLLVGARRVSHVHLPKTSEDLEWALQYGPDLLVTSYQGQAREVLRALGGSKPLCLVLDVSNAVDTTVFAPRQNIQSSALRFGGRHVVLMIGHLSEVKGYPTFLRACQQIEAALGRCEFVALGGETITQGYRAELEQLTRTLGIESQVHFLGWRRNVADVINAADVVVMASLNEGLPLAVLEAMACGKPVVATTVGGVPEAVEHGLTGLLIPPNDPRALADAVTEILRDPELTRQMGRAARCRIEARYSLPVFVARIQNLYDELVESNRYSGRVGDLVTVAPGLFLAARLARG